MILNDRQLKIAVDHRDEMVSELSTMNPIELVRSGVDPLIVETQKRYLEARISKVDAEVSRYQLLKSDGMRAVTASPTDDIGVTLIETRIARGLTQKDLAIRLGSHEQQVQRYEQDSYKTASINRVREVMRALDIEASLTIVNTLHGIGEVQGAPDLSAVVFDAFPVREMKRRNWFSDLEQQVDAGAPDSELAERYVREALGSGELRALNRQKVRVGGKLDAAAITAWRARILHKARSALRENPQTGRTASTLDPSFIQQLVKLSQHDDGPLKAVSALRERGILLCLERHLPSTHLDGAAMLLDGRVPVIGMTVRLDRLDNFWFVLLHECAHIICHRDGLDAGFFDDESVPATDAAEIEADAFASNALIPDEVWNNSFVRFTNSVEQIESFASRQGVSPAIVAGRIRNQRRNFRIFSNLVGQGEVKRQFVEANLMDK